MFTQKLNAIWFFALFLLMVIAGVPLCRFIQAAPKNEALASNVKWMSSIYLVFTVGFITRSIYDSLATIDGSSFSIWLGLAGPLLWDWLPIFLMCLFHLKEVLLDRRSNILNTSSGEVPGYRIS